jgi:hypothetical protein
VVANTMAVYKQGPVHIICTWIPAGDSICTSIGYTVKFYTCILYIYNSFKINFSMSYLCKRGEAKSQITLRLFLFCLFELPLGLTCIKLVALSLLLYSASMSCLYMVGGCHVWFISLFDRMVQGPYLSSPPFTLQY